MIYETAGKPAGKGFIQGASVETYLTTKGLAVYLQIAEQSIRRWVLNNEIPYRRIHGVIRYRLSEVEKWVDGHKEKIPACGNGNTEGGLFNGTGGGEPTGAGGLTEGAERNGGVKQCTPTCDGKPDGKGGV